MWTKAEPTNCPHSGPAGLTAPRSSGRLGSAVCSMPGKMPSLPGRGQTQTKKAWESPPPPETGQSHSPSTPKSCPQSQGPGRSRLDAGTMDSAPGRSEGLVPSQASSFHLLGGALKKVGHPGVLKGMNSVKQTRF